jgi:hypothetical protein
MSFDAFQSSASGESTSAPESTSQSTSQSTVQSAPESSPQSVSQSTHQDSPTQRTESLGTPETQKWEPNFKFKVMDQEHEMDSYFQQFVKSQDDEKKFRELYEKAYGLDVVKPKFIQARERLQQVEPQYNQLMQNITEVRDFVRRDDFDSFFKQLNIPEQKILQWVINKAKYNELPPEQRQAMDDRRAAQEESLQLKKQNEYYRSQYEAQVTQAKAHGLQVALAKPDVSQMVAQFDAKKGPGAFAREVIDNADYVWKSSNGQVDLTPEQAVQAVMDRYMMFAHQQSSGPQVVPAASAQQQKTIPNLSPRSASSVSKSKPRSLADLKKLAENFNR